MQVQIPVEDLLKGQLHTEGYYKGEVVAATSKKSKDGNSLNYEAVFKYNKDANDNTVDEREITIRFNSQAMGFMTDMLAAMAGKSVKEFAADQKAKGDTVKFEWEDIKGAKFQVRIQNKPRQDNGQLKSEVTGYYPYDYKVPF